MAIADDTTALEGRDDQIRFLVETTRTLDRADDVERALDEIGRQVVDTWADLAVVALVGEDGDLRPVALRHADPALCRRADLLQQLIRPIPGGVIEAALLGEETLVDDVAAHAARIDLDAAMRDSLLDLGVLSAVACPVRVREETLGVLLAATTTASHRRLTPADLDLLGEVASRAGRAVESDRLFSTLRVVEDRFLASFEHAPIGMALLSEDAGGNACYRDVNPALCEILARGPEELLGRPVTSFLHPGDAERPEVVGGERRYVRPDGEVRHCSVQAAPLGTSRGIVCQLLDVTEHRRDQSELARLASHDGLTGLLNRAGFEAALAGTVADSGGEGAVVILDLDHFKRLNDLHGVGAGDAMLRLVARTLSSRLRSTDAIGRVGDDEFGVVLCRTTAEAAADVAGELVRGVRSVAMPAGDEVIRPTVSAGLRAFGEGSARSAADLIGDAGAAVLDAKDRGRDRLCVAPHEPGAAVGRSCRQWSQRIREALVDDRFVLYEQPIMDVATRAIERSELLVRMLDVDGSVIEPGAFLPTAERFGQVQAIDRWVVANALELLAQRRAEGVACGVNVNLSGESLSDPAVVDWIVASVADADLQGPSLTFEVTETAAVRDIDEARRLAARLSASGCQISLDDFGTGFSSFAYLKHLPVDAVKIDGQFIRELAIDHVDRLTVQAIVDVCRGAGASTTAEYVGDDVTLALLGHLGVDFAQGYHVGRPRPAAVRPDWCAR